MESDELVTDLAVREMLSNTSTWAIVGLSADRSRPSYGVAARLQQWGYSIIPVNPNCGQEVLGEQAYCSLADIPDDIRVDVVDIFRRSDAAGAHVDEAIAIGARGVWLQLGVIDDAAIARARAAGLHAVQDRCPAIEYPRLREARTG